MQYERWERVAEEIKKELSSIIEYELKDPRLNAELISVVKVILSKDLKYAKAYVSIYDKNEENINSSFLALRNSIPFIRKEISKRLKLRYVPEIQFEMDYSIEYGARISKLIDEINKEKPLKGEDTID